MPIGSARFLLRDAPNTVSQPGSSPMTRSRQNNYLYSETGDIQRSIKGEVDEDEAKNSV
jgi:hypothetical protein